MLYFRELPKPLSDTSDELLEIFYNFATTFTEESILEGTLKERKGHKIEDKENDELISYISRQGLELCYRR